MCLSLTPMVPMRHSIVVALPFMATMPRFGGHQLLYGFDQLAFNADRDPGQVMQNGLC